jgi:hypothetical protein
MDVTIKTFKQLIDFLQNNFDRITDKESPELIRLTLNVYEYAKPGTFVETQKRLVDFYEAYKNHKHELPIFIDLNFDL